MKAGVSKHGAETCLGQSRTSMSPISAIFLFPIPSLRLATCINRPCISFISSLLCALGIVYSCIFSRIELFSIRDYSKIPLRRFHEDASFTSTRIYNNTLHTPPSESRQPLFTISSSCAQSIFTV
ncbi:hypothetical protein BU16DRAFT_369889 [Lophium mytilinum]|uniref:Uncharacterized protein n=1 Tax=Lophium mytilinum TaxID=390894 RepID=A0A6A6QUW1_9PEZI|nr:hypothetical protein BU16DRAFT_369889 [Lophium mytilinum]